MWGRANNERKNVSDNTWTDKAADKIAGAGIKLQTKITSAMNKKTSNISNRKMKTGLIFFCFISGGFSIYLAGNAIFGKEKKQTVLEVKRINTPRHFDKTGSEINAQNNYVPEHLYQELQAYKRYMDSTGQLIRKGLSDSIQMLEQIYHSQKIK